MDSRRTDISSLRREFTQKELVENNVDKDPLVQFSVWFDEALSSEVTDANAMSLATATKDGRPSCRIVLLKGFDRTGYTFFTNYNSKKSTELLENPYAALTFYWAELERQIRIEGVVQKTSPIESSAYFSSRPRESQIGALASPQSEPISRAELVSKQQEITDRFEGKEIPHPDFWGGFILKPLYYEFWQGRPSRLHDRISYAKESNEWLIKRLAP